MASLLQQLPMRKTLVAFMLLCVYEVCYLLFTFESIQIKITRLVTEFQDKQHITTRTTRIFDNGNYAKVHREEDADIKDPEIEQDPIGQFSNDIQHKVNVYSPHAIMDFDVHQKDTVYSHFRLDPHLHISTYEENRNIAAISLAITSTGVQISYNNITIESLMTELPFYRHLLPSFGKTGEAKYFYHFYFAYDTDDKFFTNAAHMDFFCRKFYVGKTIVWLCSQKT